MCPTLSTAGGHELWYTERLAAAAKAAGLAASIVHPAHAGRLFPPDTPAAVETIDVPPEGPAAGPVVVAAARSFLSARRRAFGLRAGLACADEDALTLIHTAGFADLATAARAATRTPGRMALVLRFDHYDDPRAIAALREIARLAEAHSIGLATDSEDLAQDFEAITGHRFTLARPPATVTLSAFTPRAPDAPPTFAAFGGGRPSKGFHTLPAVIEAVRSIRPDARFVVQSYAHPDDASDPRLPAARAALAQTPGVTLIDDVLGANDYARALASCDAVVLPYDPHTYRRVTSGVFVEALAAGKAAIAPVDTWMAHEACRYGLTRAACADFADPASIAAAVGPALGSLERPCAATERWAGLHDYAALLDAIIASLPAR